MSDQSTEQEPSVERETTLETSPERAWEAISDPAELERWLAEEAKPISVEQAQARDKLWTPGREGAESGSAGRLWTPGSG